MKAKCQNSSSTQWHHFWLTKSTDETGRLYWEIIIAYLPYFYTLDKTFVIGYCQKEVIRPVASTSKAVENFLIKNIWCLHRHSANCLKGQRTSYPCSDFPTHKLTQATEDYWHASVHVQTWMSWMLPTQIEWGSSVFMPCLIYYLLFISISIHFNTFWFLIKTQISSLEMN